VQHAPFQWYKISVENNSEPFKSYKASTITILKQTLVYSLANEEGEGKAGKQRVGEQRGEEGREWKKGK